MKSPTERIAITGRVKKWTLLTMMEVQVPRAHWGLVDKMAMVGVNTKRMEEREKEEKEGEEGEKEEEREEEEEEEEREEEEEEEEEGKMEKKKEGETIMARMMMMMKVLRLKKILEWKTPESNLHCQQVQFPAPLPQPLETQYRTVKQCQ